MNKPKRNTILVLGSGALKIGEAGEFDYSGSQALKALKEESIRTVLVNPNIATVQTSPLFADEIYFLPVTDRFVERVIARERPAGILLAFGGQTALNCGVKLHERGVLQKYGVRVLGTPVESIILTEDRKKFAAHLRRLGVPIPPSGAASSIAAALRFGERIGYPVMVRSAYTLGGQKSGVARNAAELRRIAGGALGISPQVLVEKYLHHFKEIEYEVVRDGADNCVTVCNMENMDPLGIHTGDSIVVAPSQTLDNAEYHALRTASIRIVRSLGIIGECNVQFALNPKRRNGSIDYYVIEVNARLSRSSALASKATGYPLAYVAAKLALGKRMDEVPNQVTKTTQSFFEPALDYAVVKIPRWDLEKFRGARESIGSAMKSVGEVMAIGRTLEEALQKAVRMLRGRSESIMDNGFPKAADALKRYLALPTPKRLFAIAEALRRGMPVSAIAKTTGIDPWFIFRVKHIVDYDRRLSRNTRLGPAELRRLKELGFSDFRIGRRTGKTAAAIRALRKRWKIVPSVFQIDTLAGEAPAKTNYLYLTYNGAHHDVEPLGRKSVLVLGSGPYHIGSSVEFDWSCVHTARALASFGRSSIIVNCNPETVSTDYDMSDRLYFENLDIETIADIFDFERPEGAVISAGGQAAQNLAKPLYAYGVPLLGTRAEDIDRAEDRNKFSALLDDLGVPQPAWKTFTTLRDADRFAKNVGYPVLVRPSYVLSGSAMRVSADREDLRRFINEASRLNREHPVTVSKFMTGAKEIELDAVAERGVIRVSAISEHIENAGVHSGDATIVYPPQKIYLATEEQIMRIARDVAAALRVSGPFNIQYLVKENRVYVIEVNLRASRSFPFVSKATGVNFAEAFTAAFFGKSKPVALRYPDYAVVKSPQFSFSRIEGADPVLHVEMSSTGEVACFGDTMEEALLTAVAATAKLSDEKTVILSLGGDIYKQRFLESAVQLAAAGYRIYATSGTTAFLRSRGIRATPLHKMSERASPNIADIIRTGAAAFVVNLSEEDGPAAKTLRARTSDGFLIRRAAVDRHIPLFTDLHLARAFIRAITTYDPARIAIKSWRAYRA